MNHRQEIGLWVFGLVLAYTSATNGQHDGQWLFEMFVPVLIVGTLVVHSLRTRVAQAERTTGVSIVAAGLLILGAVVVIGSVEHGFVAVAEEVEDVGNRVDAAADEIEDVGSTVERLADNLDDLAYKVDDVCSRR